MTLGIDQPAEAGSLLQLLETLQAQLLVSPQSDVNQHQPPDRIENHQPKQTKHTPGDVPGRAAHRLDGHDRRRHLIEQKQTQHAAHGQHHHANQRMAEQPRQAEDRRFGFHQFTGLLHLDIEGRRLAGQVVAGGCGQRRRHLGQAPFPLVGLPGTRFEVFDSDPLGRRRNTRGGGRFRPARSLRQHQRHVIDIVHDRLRYQQMKLKSSSRPTCSVGQLLRGETRG